jgi:hypothetical protein
MQLPPKNSTIPSRKDVLFKKVYELNKMVLVFSLQRRIPKIQSRRINRKTSLRKTNNKIIKELKICLYPFPLIQNIYLHDLKIKTLTTYNHECSLINIHKCS